MDMKHLIVLTFSSASMAAAIWLMIAAPAVHGVG
jgi:hypothetical protein